MPPKKATNPRQVNWGEGEKSALIDYATQPEIAAQLNSTSYITQNTAREVLYLTCSCTCFDDVTDIILISVFCRPLHNTSTPSMGITGMVNLLERSWQTSELKVFTLGSDVLG